MCLQWVIAAKYIDKAVFVIKYRGFRGGGGMADAPDLGSGVIDVGVQVPSSAPFRNFSHNIEGVYTDCS